MMVTGLVLWVFFHFMYLHKQLLEILKSTASFLIFSIWGQCIALGMSYNSQGYAKTGSNRSGAAPWGPVTGSIKSPRQMEKMDQIQGPYRLSRQKQKETELETWMQ